MNGWYVACTHPNQEKRAEENLRRQGFSPWVPTFARLRRHARRVERVRTPLFPGYLFVEFDPAREPWSAIHSTFGVKRLICRRDVPARLPEGFAENLRAHVESPDFVAPEDRLDAGDRVRITDGPFVDAVGFISSIDPQQRVSLLLSLLGREISVVVPRDMVVLAS